MHMISKPERIVGTAVVGLGPRGMYLAGMYSERGIPDSDSSQSVTVIGPALTA